MKNVKLYSMALAALMLGACSSDEVAVDGGQNGGAPGSGKSYLSLAINLPTQPATRAVNDRFDDGLVEEYDVRNAVLLVFKGDAESTATLSGGYNMTLPTFSLEGTPTDQITSTVELTQAINDAASDANKLYALVVLNTGNVITVDNSNSVSINGEAFKGTFADFQKETMKASNGDVSSIASADKGFLMMNAPLANAVGASPYTGKVTTLTPLNGKVYETEKEAMNNPAANVYVERAVAKVEVNATKTTGTVGDRDDLSWNIEGWTLNNINTTSYLVRNVDDSWWSLQNGDKGFRFIGTVPVRSGESIYRTYWGIDPNYAEDNKDGIYSIYNTAPTTLNDVGDVAYCLENTFDIASMDKDKTTTVIVAATLGNGEDFFTLGGSANTLYKKDGLDKAVKSAFMSDPVVANELKKSLKGGEANVFGESDIESVTYSTSEAGTWLVTGITYAKGAADKFKDGKIPETLLENGTAYNAGLENATGLKIACYKGGMAYYPVLIEHFGDELTPWAQTDASNGDAYPGSDAAAKWLGRWGVLRNNWYEINVTGINNVGYPTVPEIGGQDDPVRSYISVKINVLSWAKRSQSVEL